MENDDNLPVRLGRSPGPGWVPVARGLHRLPAGESFRADLLAWQSLLRPTAVFTHLTMARARGWWLSPLPDDLPVFVAMDSRHNAPKRAGLRVSRRPGAPAVEIVDGLRLAPAAEGLLACAEDLGDLDLVCLVDAALRNGDCTYAELATIAAGRRRGAPRLRRALDLADPRSESIYECLLRILHRVCGIEVEPQHVVLDPAGVEVARGDLWLVGTRALHEYDGCVHLLRRQQRKDLKRSIRIGHAAWERRGYTADEVLHQAVSILRDVDSSLGREHDPSRVRPWHELLKESTLPPPGQARLRRRLSLPDAVDGLGA